ncbi:MAG TPA: TolC family protein, partial [Pseudomonas sp.]|nr:TolC family protein [Pseudomonas sp.]
MRIGTLIVALAAMVSGCSVGPDYTRPSVESPEAWRINYPAAAGVANTTWWEQFGDPVLNELVDSALRENLDVRIAAARVDQFVGALNSTRSQLYPQLGYSAGASNITASRVGQPPLPPGADRDFSLYEGAVGASWQLDLFGRVSRLSEAAQARVYASEQAQHGVVLSLVASVANSYITLRALDRQLE